jgi:ribosomal protein S18 acetylase RimI-like enzyme
MTQVRTATLNDIPSIIEIWEECKLTRPWNNPKNDITNALITSTSTILLLCNQAQILGTIMAGYDGHRGWIYYLAVKGKFQNKGFGRKLIIEAEKWLANKNVNKVNLMVRNSNKSVITFYQNVGYKDDDVVVLSKWLNDSNIKK